MEERSLRVLPSEKTFFTKITSTISKLLVPTKVGINGIMITMKRSSLLKAYENYKEAENSGTSEKMDVIINRYEEAYSLYLESIDKYIMDSVYKKVKNGVASNFEKEALSKYYTITQLKETEYLEYKHKKQKYLLELDYETISESNKEKVLNKYLPFYIEKQDYLYKGILKNYSIQLADNLSSKLQSKDEIYNKIFDIIEEYVNNILPLKKDISNKNLEKEKNEYEQYAVGKLDEKDIIEKNRILLGISREIFTHSLPLIAAEQCYVRLLKQTRNLIVNGLKSKQEKTYKMLIKIIEDYNVKLLSTKVYWDKPEKRDDYKKFWNKYKNIKKKKEKEILKIKYYLIELNRRKKDYLKIIKMYKEKLVKAGAMKEFKNSCKTIQGKYTGSVIKNKCMK